MLKLLEIFTYLYLYIKVSNSCLYQSHSKTKIPAFGSCHYFSVQGSEVEAQELEPSGEN